MYVVFFFQAEDGIRDTSVTGVQTCAFPICPRVARRQQAHQFQQRMDTPSGCGINASSGTAAITLFRSSMEPALPATSVLRSKIGRASCRERGLMSCVVRVVERK